MNRYDEFSNIVKAVKICDLCPRMNASARVLNGSSGGVYSDLMFIGEAPGRRGADETEIPFHGDTSGNNFEDFLSTVGLSRADFFITNAALCNPKDEKGNNATPSSSEIRNCSGHLRRQVDLVDPKIVVTLGGVALRALSNIQYHEVKLKSHVRTVSNWYGRKLIPLYHPGQRAMIHRSRANQRSDYQFVAEQWRRLSKNKRAPSRRPIQEDVLDLCGYLLDSFGQISYFELHKLMYLTEYLHVHETGRRLTRGYFIRQKDGPYCTDLQISRLKKSMPSLSVSKEKNDLFVSLKVNQSLPFEGSDSESSSDLQDAVDRVKARYRYRDNADLKKIVYLTAPMRVILRRESRDNENLFNSPIDFLAGSAA